MCSENRTFLAHSCSILSISAITIPFCRFCFVMNIGYMGLCRVSHMSRFAFASAVEHRSWNYLGPRPGIVPGMSKICGGFFCCCFLIFSVRDVLYSHCSTTSEVSLWTSLKTKKQTPICKPAHSPVSDGHKGK